MIFRWAVLVVAAILTFGTAAHAQRGPGAAAVGGTITAVQIQGNVRAEPGLFGMIRVCGLKHDGPM